MQDKELQVEMWIEMNKNNEVKHTLPAFCPIKNLFLTKMMSVWHGFIQN